MDEDYFKKVRGEIVHEMVEVENLMSYLIATYFCSHKADKHSEVQFIILMDSRFNLDFKKDVIAYIVDKHYDRDFINSFISEFLEDKKESLISFISTLINYRNAAAHFNWFPEPNTQGYNYKLIAMGHKKGELKEKPARLINRENVNIFIEKCIALKLLLTKVSNDFYHKNNRGE